MTYEVTLSGQLGDFVRRVQCDRIVFKDWWALFMEGDEVIAAVASEHVLSIVLIRS